MVNKDIEIGEYEHSKSGRRYQVIGVARHSETLEEMVVYQAKYNSDEFGENAIWVRPREMFQEKVMVDGKNLPRFKKV